MKIIKKIWKWYYTNWLSGGGDTNVPLNKLKWLPKNLKRNSRTPFGSIDTIIFDIKNMPLQEEVVIEYISESQVKEVLQCAVRS